MRISDWSSDVCSSDHPSSVLRQLGENLIDLDLADRRRGLVVCIDPPPLNRAARITGSVQTVMHPGSRAEITARNTPSLPNTSCTAFTLPWRSEDRSVGKECVRTCRCRVWP